MKTIAGDLQKMLLNTKISSTEDGYLSMWEIAEKLGVSHVRAGDIVRQAVNEKKVKLILSDRSVPCIDGRFMKIKVYQFKKI